MKQNKALAYKHLNSILNQAIHFRSANTHVMNIYAWNFKLFFVRHLSRFENSVPFVFRFFGFGRSGRPMGSTNAWGCTIVTRTPRK
jgi:hypothetical protein